MKQKTKKNKALRQFMRCLEERHKRQLDIERRVNELLLDKLTPIIYTTIGTVLFVLLVLVYLLLRI